MNMRLVQNGIMVISMTLAIGATAAAAQSSKGAKHSKNQVTKKFGALFAKEAGHAKAENARSKPAVKASGQAGPKVDKNLRVETAERKTAHRGAREGSHSSQSSIYNQKVAPKGTPLAKGNRAVNPKTGDLLFSVNSDSHLLDSMGRSRGEVAGKEVKINYGATRKFKDKNGVTHVFHQAWSTPLKGGKIASGWIRRTNLNDKPKMPTITARRPPSGPKTAFTITGGNPRSEKFGYKNASGQFVPYKVTKQYKGGGRDATDYLFRPGGVVNQSFNLPGKGGVSYDSYQPGTTFKRADSIPSITRPLYYPGGTKQVGHLTFVYGGVDTPTGRRFGWIPLQAMKPRR
jgi:hypothetical protein